MAESAELTERLPATGRRSAVRSGLRSRAMLLVLITLLPALGFVLHAAYETYLVALDSSRRAAQLLARQVAAQQSSLVERTEDLMTGIAFMARSDGVSPMGADCPKVLRALVARYSAYASAAIADAQGRVVCLSNDFRGAVNLSDRPYFQRVVAQRRFVWDGPIQGRMTQLPLMVAAAPLIGAADDLRGVLIFTMRLDAIERTLEASAVPDRGTVTLVDRSGTVLARFPASEQLTNRTVLDLEPFLAFVSGQSVEPHARVGLEGIERVWAYARLPGHPDSQVFVRVGFPTAPSVQAARHVLAEGLVTLGMILAAGLALAWFGAGTLIVQPLRRLQTAAELMGRGNLAARTGLPSGGDEIGQLAGKLDELAAHGQRVNRALRTLSAGNRTLLRERDERSLLAAMCQVAVERGGYAVAYVCYPRDDAEKTIDVVAQAGEDSGYIASARFTWADTQSGRGSAARCIRTGERVIIRSIADDAGTGPWQAAAAERGFAAVISLPLRVQSQLVGTLTLMARERDAFDADEVELLDEMAADLSFGIEVIRAEARRKEAEAIARRALTHDPVIDMPNRGGFVGRVVECIERGSRNHEPVAILDVHLGRLQDIVDSFGYEYGNQVLRQVAQRLAELPGAEENLGRIPVEDFGIVLCAYDADAAMRMAQAALEVLKAPVRLGEAPVDLQAAIGISVYPGHGAEAETLVQRASIAAREAFRKDLPLAVYSGAMGRENPARLALAAQLRSAIDTRQLELHYQPKVRLDGAPSGCEALVRWRHPSRGMVPPLEFIGLAEEIGLIRPLTYHIIDLAIRQIHAWRTLGISTAVAVNLSARNLYDPRLLDTIEALFSTWNVPRELLHFEITEGALVDDPKTAKRMLERLSEHGAKIFVDDFGTGYSSLSYLVSLPVHALKIDRSFIQQMSTSKQARGLVSSIVSMAHGLDLKVVAEGVETEGDMQMLHALGCDEAQGYFFCKPLPAADFAAPERRRLLQAD